MQKRNSDRPSQHTTPTQDVARGCESLPTLSLTQTGHLSTPLSPKMWPRAANHCAHCARAELRQNISAQRSHPKCGQELRITAHTARKRSSDRTSQHTAFNQDVARGCESLRTLCESVAQTDHLSTPLSPKMWPGAANHRAHCAKV